MCFAQSGARAGVCQPTTYGGLPAFRLSDGQSEAVVVPSLSGRVMRYGLVGGPNLLWNNLPSDAPPATATSGFRNVGGDKTFVGPHSSWPLFAPGRWPPQPSWDGPPHTALVLAGGALRTTGPLWNGFGTRVVREFSFAKGEFSIKARIEKVAGAVLPLCLWNVSQAARPDAVFLRLNPDSAYKRGFHPFGALPDKARIEAVSPALLQITPSEGAYYKIGVDSPVAALCAVTNETAWVQRAAKSPDEYPDGAEGAGFPVEFYNHGDKDAGGYVELELLSPLRPFRRGTSWTHTVHWSLHALPPEVAHSPAALRQSVQLLLETP